MNNVSWFIYGAEVLQSIGICLTIISIITGIACLIAWEIFTACKMDGDKPMTRYPSILTTISLGSMFIAAVLPSKTTMYAIAASQIGQQAISSPEAKEMLDDTKQILRDYLKSLKGEAKK